MTPPEYTAGSWISNEYATRVVDYFIAVLERDNPDLLLLLRENPEGAIRVWPGLTLSLADDNDPDVLSSDCPTAGLYISSPVTSRIIVARSPSRGRNSFTILHELSHHLQRNDNDWVDLLCELDDNQAKTLEHLVCDEFASEILMPKTAFVGFSAKSYVTASDVRNIYEESRASRAAAIVRTAKFLAPNSVSLLVTTSGEVVFSKSRGDVISPPRQSKLAGDLIANAVKKSNLELHGTVDFLYRTGTRLNGLGATAAVDSDYRYIFVVAAKLEQYDDIKTEWRPTVIECPCGESFESSKGLDPCVRCNKRICPDCERCYCLSGVEVVCSVCSLALSRRDIFQKRTIHEECF